MVLKEHGHSHKEHYYKASSGDLELTRCKSTVKAICFGLVNLANYPDQ